MSPLFGQGLFAAVTGVVSAAGLAVCLATGQGKIEVRKFVSGVTASGTAQIQGKQYRTRKIPVRTASAQANAQGNAKVDWQVAGTAYAVATAYGRGKADFFAAGTADVYGYMGGSPYRLTKPRTYTAKGTATLEGEAYVFQILEGAPAIGTASLYGTTYHLAYGTAVGEITAQGRLVWEAGAKAQAEATADASGQAAYTIALYGQEALTESSVHGHEAVTRNGIRYLEAYGEAVCEGIAENSFIGVHPSVTAFCTAEAEGRGTYLFGGKGHAKGYCTLKGTMLAASTAVTLVESVSVASATGRIRAWHKFKGEASVTAQGSGTYELKKTGVQGQGTSSATGSGSIKVTNTKAYPDTAYGVAQIKGTMNRIRTIAGGPVNVFARGQGQVERKHIVYGVALGEAIPKGIPYKTVLSGGKAQAEAKGQLTHTQVSWWPNAAVGSSTLAGEMYRTLIYKGVAVVTASSSVGIQVNDAAKAPTARTLVVSEEVRTTYVLAESRTVVV